MKKTFRLVYIILTVLYFSYLAIPNPAFPEPPEDALRSNEPADIETPLRRGYFTDLGREEVMSHYLNQFSYSNNMKIPFITYRLNYPPEEAQTLIRDQTRSTFLEEIVHPFRESLFVNGFEPTEDKDLIRVNGKLWRQKVIVRYYPSSVLIRLTVGIMTGLMGLLLIEFTGRRVVELMNIIKKSYL